jgi:hypothetical protein
MKRLKSNSQTPSLLPNDLFQKKNFNCSRTNIVSACMTSQFTCFLKAFFISLRRDYMQTIELFCSGTFPCASPSLTLYQTSQSVCFGEPGFLIILKF